MTHLRSRLTYANVISTLALFLALSGATAMGASLLTGADIRNGSLTGADIRNHSVSAADLTRGSITGAFVHNGTLTGADLENGSIMAADFNPADLEALRGPKGDPGATGQQGPQGPVGPEGQPGASGIERASWSVSDVTGYVNDTPLVDQTIPRQGGWLMLANLLVTNSGPSDDWFSCGLFVGTLQIGGGGDNVPAGTTRELNSVGFGPVDANEHAVLKCESGGGGTFDLTNVSLKLAKLM